MRFRLDDLEYAAKMKIMDIAIALVDRARFELMRRMGLGGDGSRSGAPHHSSSAARGLAPAGAEFAREIPRLCAGHPDYPAYTRLNHLDRVVFIRRLIPRAVETFREGGWPGRRTDSGTSPPAPVSRSFAGNDFGGPSHLSPPRFFSS